MATEPIRERILQDCETALDLINGTGDYHFALATIFRAKAWPATLDLLPAAKLSEGVERAALIFNGQVARTLSITVEARVGSQVPEIEDLPTVGNRLLADIERALTADPTRSGLANSTVMVENAVRTDEDPGILASVTVDFEIQYQTRQGDPASLG